MSNSKKRAAEPAPAAKATKKRKGNFQDNESLDTELNINTLFARMDNQLLADHFAQKLSRFGKELSSIEISDLTISANVIQDTTSWQEDRIADKLPGFLEEFSEGEQSLKKAPKQNGSPHTIVVAGAGLRSADLVRSLRKFSTKGHPITKLFAKHMKIKEQISLLKSKQTAIGVGTPERLIALIENGALSLENLQRVVIDASHIDQKKRGIMDMSETMMPLARLLTRPEFSEKYLDEKKPLALLFY